MADEPFLSRWAKRKSDARAGGPAPGEPAPGEPAPARPVAQPAPAAAVAEARAPLPSIESLTPESDFTGFMRPEVDEGLKRRALRSLFTDPHFNVMDGLDVYIDDYSKPDPMPESWLSQLNQMARLGAYEEKPAKEAADAPEEAAEGSAEALGAIEKPSDEQGLASPPSSDSSDTPDVVGAPPSMPQ